MEWIETFFPQPNTCVHSSYRSSLKDVSKRKQNARKNTVRHTHAHATNWLGILKKGMTFIDRPPFYIAVLRNISLSICKYFIVDMIRLHTLSTNHLAYFACLNRFDILDEFRFFVRLNSNAKWQVNGELL